MVLEKNEGDQLDRSCEMCGVTESHGEEEHPTYDKTQECCCVGLVLHSNSLVRHVIEGKIKGTGDWEEGVSSYWMTSRKCECTGILKRKH